MGFALPMSSVPPLPPPHTHITFPLLLHKVDPPPSCLTLCEVTRCMVHVSFAAGCDSSRLHLNLPRTSPPGGTRSAKVPPQTTRDPLVLSEELSLPSQMEEPGREV